MLTVVAAPSRTTVGRNSLSSDRAASVRALRYSWMVPIRVLNTITNPNSASCQGATIIMATHRVPIRALNQVRVLVRMMLARLRLPVSRTLLTWPAATRARTSWLVKPCWATVTSMPTRLVRSAADRC